MPYYSEELIEQVRSGNDIVDVVSGYVRLQKKGSRYFGLCPFHSEKTGSFNVNPSSQMYYCFGCGAGGNVITFVMQYENFTFQEALSMLADKAGITLPQGEMSREEKARDSLRSQVLDVNKEAATYFYKLLRSPKGKRAYEYFLGRELSPETMHDFGLGYSDKYSDDLYKYLKAKGYSDELLKVSGLISIDEKRGGRDKFWNRAMFPIMDIHNKVIGFGGRVMGEGEPKYLNSPETIIFDKSRNLYALNIARKSKRSGILLCEGYMDVISLHQAGFDNAVAALGTAFTMQHANLLKRYTSEVYLTFDSDGAGRKAALRAIPILNEAGITSRVIDMTPYKDPDEYIKALGPESFEDRIKNAENSFMFRIRMLESDFDLSDPGGKTAFFRAAAERILEFPEELERENYIDSISAKYSIRRSMLREMVIARAGAGVKRTTDFKPKPERKDRKKDDINRQTQKFLLTWLIEEQRIFEMTRAYIGPDDFTDDMCHQVAEILYQQYSDGKIIPAAIINSFEEPEDQSEVASMFNSQVARPENAGEKEKALRDAVYRIKKNAFDQKARSQSSADPALMQQLIEDKLKLNSLKKVVFGF